MPIKKHNPYKIVQMFEEEIASNTQVLLMQYQLIVVLMLYF
jgi:hypothetical protein